MTDSLHDLAQQLGEFARDRDWQQFHTPKNLAMALTGEAGELLEIFQWLTPEESANLTDEQRRGWPMSWQTSFSTSSALRT